MELLGIVPAAFFASEIDKAAMRCVLAAWPQVGHLGAIESITDATWRRMTGEFPRVSMRIFPAGFPCHYVSVLNRHAWAGPGRKGSSLDLEAIRVLEPGRAFCEGFARALLLGENVASADEDEVATVSSDLCVRALEACTGDVSGCRRPRVYLPDREVEAEEKVVWSFGQGRWVAKLLPDGLPPCREWLDKGAELPGEASNACLPTLTRAVSKRWPPKHPAGIEGMVAHEIERWRCDNFAQPACQYCDGNCILDKSGALRKPSSAEREALLGFARDHTIPAVRSAQLSSNWREMEHIREALLGNSFSCAIVAWLLGHLLFREKMITRRPTIEELARGKPLSLGSCGPQASVEPAETDGALDEARAAASPGRALVTAFVITEARMS